MSGEVSFLDLMVLRRIDENSVVEKFGTKINTSFFETANLLGSLKVKGYVDIESSIGGSSPIILTATGRKLLQEVAEKTGEQELDVLDETILKNLASGVRELKVLESAVNVNSRDLAMHLSKLQAQRYIDPSIRSANVNLSLTEKGFTKVGGVKGKSPPEEKSEMNDEEKPEAERILPNEEQEGEPIPKPAMPEVEMPLETKRMLSKFIHYLEKYWYILALLALLMVFVVILAIWQAGLI